MTKKKKDPNNDIAIDPIYTGGYIGKDKEIAGRHYWTQPQKLAIASPNPMLYPRSLWRKVEECLSILQPNDPTK